MIAFQADLDKWVNPAFHLVSDSFLLVELDYLCVSNYLT